MQYYLVECFEIGDMTRFGYCDHESFNDLVNLVKNAEVLCENVSMRSEEDEDDGYITGGIYYIDPDKLSEDDLDIFQSAGIPEEVVFKKIISIRKLISIEDGEELEMKEPYEIIPSIHQRLGLTQ